MKTISNGIYEDGTQWKIVKNDNGWYYLSHRRNDIINNEWYMISSTRLIEEILDRRNAEGVKHSEGARHWVVNTGESYHDEMKRLIDEAIQKAERTARNKGYAQGIEDFYKLLATTHLTPTEIYKKLYIDV